tara:strand:+ start:158 stop:841 length:684 start_codon:yes stop_codon:yes gene_type:complete
MILIDTVYQKVLMFANKEQRGYITPQEFNLYADQAQKEIFEQYFYDLDKALLLARGNSDEYADKISNLQEKISIFESKNSSFAVPGSLSSLVYRLGTITYDGCIVEEVQYQEYLYMKRAKLIKPNSSMKNYVYVKTGSRIETYPEVGVVSYTYIRAPKKPSWGYVVVKSKAMYDPTNPSNKNFELHQSEETELVYKILKFAGISMQRTDLTQAAQGMEISQIQQEKQ